MASRKKSKNISAKPELPNSISFTTSFCSSFKMIFPFAFRKTLIESKYKHTFFHHIASRRARITRLTEEPISISRPPAYGGLSPPLPHPPSTPIFLLSPVFSFEFVQSNSPHRIFRLLTRPPATAGYLGIVSQKFPIIKSFTNSRLAKIGYIPCDLCTFCKCVSWNAWPFILFL